MGSRYWRRRPGEIKINALTAPVGELISHFVATAPGDVLEIIPPGNQHVVVENENGVFRCRAGILDARAFTVDVATDELIFVSHPYENLDGPLRVSSTVTLPPGLVADTDYWVRDVDGLRLRLSLTQGGPAVDITGAGAGVHSIGGDNGAAAAVGFAPPAVATLVDYGTKELRTDEIRVFNGPVTFSAVAAAAVLTYWYV